MQDSGAGDASAYDRLEHFFGIETIHEIAIEISDEGLESLSLEPYTYVKGRVVIDGNDYPDVGVRLKGSYGSFTPLDNPEPYGYGPPGKSAFIVKFNEYVKGQKHLGLTKLTINNMAQDPTRLNEFLGYSLFRALAVPASRTGYAVVGLNGGYRGFYSLIESTDNHEFLDHWFGTHDGYLYEGEAGSDVDLYSYFYFDQDNGEDTSKQDLRILAQKLDMLEGKPEVVEGLQEVLDLDTVLRFIAAEIFTAHWDGYTWARNNFQIHHDPGKDRWTLVPWGTDQLFRYDPVFQGAYNGVLKPQDEVESYGRIHRICMKSDDCPPLVRTALEEVMSTAEDMDLAGLAGKAWNVIAETATFEAAFSEDYPFSVGEPVDTYAFLEERRSQIETWIDCFDKGTVDHDNDGYNGCLEDCDDFSDAVKPLAAEDCNLKDDDCNGMIDDAEGCPRCFEATDPYAEYTLSFCFDAVSWQDARQACLDRGWDLVSIHDDITRDYLFQVFLEQMGILHVWIGLNSLESDGEYAWSDGTPVDYEAWSSVMPDPTGTDEPCVSQYVNIWIDLPCETPLPYVCKERPR